jgi:hypothetical protein
MYIGEYDRYFSRSNKLSVMTRVTLYWEQQRVSFWAEACGSRCDAFTFAPVLSKVELERMGRLEGTDHF